MEVVLPVLIPHWEYIHRLYLQQFQLLENDNMLEQCSVESLNKIRTIQIELKFKNHVGADNASNDKKS